ncbi:MAG: 3-hydroxyacyl-CoA dehydrogenase [Porticoccaceae bacterium]|jgi:3-hydroxyacyl-CoA dehydrogenase/3-hydroxy-2-methylbutyryl-CoA dehydrogenase|nr:3-hydroxyacyl-CoA dehydrogenase [Porticoccaceae bacterium]MDB9734642.1 3-hydroxyacyl-CoA dehydrogenase [Porticoccaceae bacterium]
MNIDKKVAVVTGGASGLGRAAAELLINSGATVVIFDMNVSAGEQAVAELGASLCHFMQLDVSNGPDVEAAFATILENLGRVDICVNCAGIGIAAKTVDREGQPHSLDLYRKVIEVNLIGTFNVSRCAAAAMAKNEPDEKTERGVIVNTASIAAFDGQMGQVAYAATKGGIVGMTLPMARDLSKQGIRVNTIAPGVMATPLMLAAPQNVQDGIVANIPFPQRLGAPSEFGQLVVHITENSYLNGETIRLDGGVRMQPR